MLHIIEITPKARHDQRDAINRGEHSGKKYIAGVTSHYYIAKLVKAEIEKQASHLKVEIVDTKPKLKFPLFIYELDNQFTYHQAPANSMHSPLLKNKDGILYRLETAWFPEQIGKDMMAYLDHHHLEGGMPTSLYETEFKY